MRPVEEEYPDQEHERQVCAARHLIRRCWDFGCVHQHFRCVHHRDFGCVHPQMLGFWMEVGLVGLSVRSGTKILEVQDSVLGRGLGLGMESVFRVQGSWLRVECHVFAEAL
eukprot:1140207-Rhodomonas_salina.1